MTIKSIFFIIPHASIDSSIPQKIIFDLEINDENQTGDPLVKLRDKQFSSSALSSLGLEPRSAGVSVQV